mmetsp:Transcript_17157/g.29088  ORF Transcript_17157/g.29088 Transcript_17157/m.29088 type:complete len:96 (-) Transcript_17157:640-927(-)
MKCEGDLGMAVVAGCLVDTTAGGVDQTLGVGTFMDPVLAEAIPVGAKVPTPAGSGGFEEAEGRTELAEPGGGPGGGGGVRNLGRFDIGLCRSLRR